MQSGVEPRGPYSIGLSWCRFVWGGVGAAVSYSMVRAGADWYTVVQSGVGAQMTLLDRFELLDQFECGVLWVPEEPNPWFELRFLIIKLWLFNHL
jgi:hypothetical protein